MCRFEILFHDDALGFVVHCNECDKIQVTFGNAAVTLSLDEFDSFRLMMMKIQLEQQGLVRTDARILFIPTPCERMNMVLSNRELDELVNMLDKADNEMKSLSLLKLFTAQ